MSDLQKPGVPKILTRAAILYAPFLLISLFTMFFFLSFYIKVDIENIESDQKLILSLQKKRTGNSFSEIFADIKFLSDTDTIRSFCQKNSRKTSELEDLLFYFIKNKRVYDQIRILSTSGMEELRVNYKNGNPEVVSHDQLQDKSHRYYFKKSLDIQPNTVYITPMDLNVENKELEAPEKPTIRFVFPLYDYDDNLKNLLVFNYDAKNLLDDIKDHESLSFGYIYLLNKDSYWLVSNDRRREFAFDKGDAESFQDLYPDEWDTINITEQGMKKSPNGLFFYTTLRPVPTLASESSDIIDLSLSDELNYAPSGYEWKLVTFVPQELLAERYSHISNFTYAIFGMVNIAFIIASISIVAVRLSSSHRDALHKKTQEEYVQELKSKRAELQEQVVETQELVHILCHDLVNPIGCVTGMLEIYYEEQEDEYKEIIDGSLKQATDIIDMVRTMRALDSGKRELQLTPVNLRDAVNTATTLMSHRFKDKNISFRVDVDSSYNVMADKPSLINSVINNLLSNAMKFSPIGSVVEISASHEGEKVCLIIKDYGKGMPKSIADNIFDPSKPTTRQGTEGETGTGFGMPLVNKFMNVYKGSIRVVSREQTRESVDHGTSIILTFSSAQNHQEGEQP